MPELICNFNGTEINNISEAVHTQNLARFADSGVKNTMLSNPPYTTTLYINTYFSKAAVFQLVGQSSSQLRHADIFGVAFHYSIDGNANLVLTASACDCNGLRLSASGVADRNLLSLPESSSTTSNTVIDMATWLDYSTNFETDKYAKVKATSLLSVKFKKSQMFGLLTADAFTAQDGWAVAKLVIKQVSTVNYLGIDVIRNNPSPTNFAYSTDPCPPICY